MARKTLTDRGLKALKPAAAGTRYSIMDTEVPGLGVRVTDKGHKTFILAGRFPGARTYTRRELGEYGAITLERARALALEWRDLARKGVDPRVERERALRQEEQRRKNTFKAVAEDFFADKLPSERKGREVERDIRREFMPLWGQRPVSEITDLDVLTAIKAKRRTAPAQARNLLGHLKRLFAWAVDQRCYGLPSSPCDQLKPSKIVGEKVTGDRVLSDEEIFALWRGAGRLGYPHGSVYRLLLLTALRLNEAADATRAELDLPNRLWTIPAARMKGRNGKARAHAVPLTEDALTLIQALPQFKKGTFLFSITFGESPVWMTDKVKKRLDRRMLRTLRALARRRGDDPGQIALPPWTNHDIRRTVRSRLSRLRVTEEAREAVLAHARPGIKGTYDLHDYLDEKREALELWGARLREIVEPPPSNVVAFAPRAEVIER